MLRRPPAGKSGERYVECTPEKVHGAGFPDELAAKALKHTVRLQQCTVESLDLRRIIRLVHAVLIESNRRFDLDRTRPDLDGNPQFVEPRHYFGIEVRGCSWLQRNASVCAIARFDRQYMINEIKGDLEASRPVGNGRRGKSARRYVKGRVPPVVHRRSLGQPDLSHDLRPHVQRFITLAPFLVRKGGPLLNFSHDR